MAVATRPDVPLTEEPDSAGRRRTVWFVGALVALLVLGFVVLPHLVWLRASEPEFSEGAAVSLPEYGADGTYVLAYQHGGEMVLRTRVTNRSLVPITVTDVRLTDEAKPLVDTTAVRADGEDLPATVWPGQGLDLTVEAGFGNCRYYHEREVQVMDGLLVDARSAGRRFTRSVDLDQRLLVHAPMLVGCPDRTLDRGDDVRR